MNPTTTPLLPLGGASSSLAILCSGFSIGALLSRGCLLPGFIEPPGTLEDSWNSLPCFAGQIPADLVRLLAGSARNLIPIAVVLEQGRQVRRFALANELGSLDVVPLADVQSVCFRSEKELQRYSGLEFSNYDISSVSVPFEVKPELFEGPEQHPADAGTNPGAAPAEFAATCRGVVRRSDCLSGLLATIATASSGLPSWMAEVQSIFKRTKATAASIAGPRALFDCATTAADSAARAHERLLSAAVRSLTSYPVEAGWPAEQFLDQVTTAAVGSLAEGDRIRHEVELWARRAEEVMASRAEPQSLSDEAFVVERALLLLLLRGDTTGIQTPDESDNAPGARVRGLALALAGYRTGLRALPAEFKKGLDNSGRWLRYLGEVFVDALFLNGAALSKEILGRIKVDHTVDRTLRSTWRLTLGDTPVSSIRRYADPALERALSLVSGLNQTVDEFLDDQLVIHMTMPNSARRDVFIKVLPGSDRATPFVRVSSPALKLAGVHSRSKIRKELVFTMLEKHSAAGALCRYAIGDSSDVIDVVSDQPLEWLDESRMGRVVMDVATTAAEPLAAAKIPEVKA